MKGWFEKSRYYSNFRRHIAPKHRKAALKGWSHKRYGYPRIPKTKIKARFERQKKASRVADLRRTAKHTYSIKNRKMVHRWWKDPSRFDLKDIDTYIRRQERAIKRKKVKKEIIKKEIKRAPTKEKKREIVKREYIPIVRDIRKREEHLKQTRQYKKQVNYIKDTTKCNYIEAQGLLQRCHRKGITYDEVNWDRLQGKDLSYRDRVDRLDKQIGKTYVGPTEYGEPADIRLREQQFYERQEEYMRELGIPPSGR